MKHSEKAGPEPYKIKTLEQRGLAPATHAKAGAMSTIVGEEVLGPHGV